MPADPAFAAVPAHLNPVIQGDLWLSWIAREGLTALALPPEAGGHGTRTAEVQAQALFFRDDEILDIADEPDAGLSAERLARITAVDRVLRAALT